MRSFVKRYLLLYHLADALPKGDISFIQTQGPRVLRKTTKSGCINPCVSTISHRFFLYIPITVKLSAHARAQPSIQSPPSLNMLISIGQ